MWKVFFEKYFAGKSWVRKSEDVYDRVKSEYANGQWTAFPDPPTEAAVWQWLSNFQINHLSETRGIYYTTASTKDLTGLEVDRQLDILLEQRDANSGEAHHWQDVRVIGEHKASNADSSAKFHQLARYARDIFSAQPTRRFVHGFLLLGTIMELIVFDRSGAFGAGPFDINIKPECFIRALSGYALMEDAELGLDTYVQKDGARGFVMMTDDRTGERTRYDLETKPLAKQRDIVCRGTCCYRTVDQKQVIKFSWRSDARLPEADYLRKAQEIGVKGVALLTSHETLTSIAELREDLTFGMKRKLRDPSRETSPSVSRSASASSTRRPEAKRSDTQSNAKRRSIDDDFRPSKLSRSTSRVSKLRHEFMAEDGSWDNKVQTAQSDASVAGEGGQNLNRILSCLAISPVGRPLEEYKSTAELLRCFRDAIKAHQSLFIDAKLLHRDISRDNIMITDRANTNGLSGMLIDLELATSVDSNGKNERSGAQKMTGTLKYMAIEVVEQAFSNARPTFEHTYRHDLESFFYVFLDICIDCGWHIMSRPRSDPLIGWYDGSYESIVLNKSGGMGKAKFVSIVLDKFSPGLGDLKGLALALREALFLQGDIYTGTPTDPTPLYRSMINAFDEALRSL